MQSTFPVLRTACRPWRQNPTLSKKRTLPVDFWVGQFRLDAHALIGNLDFFLFGTGFQKLKASAVQNFKSDQSGMGTKVMDLRPRSFMPPGSRWRRKLLFQAGPKSLEPVSRFCRSEQSCEFFEHLGVEGRHRLIQTGFAPSRHRGIVRDYLGRHWTTTRWIPSLGSYHAMIAGLTPREKPRTDGVPQ